MSSSDGGNGSARVSSSRRLSYGPDQLVRPVPVRLRSHLTESDHEEGDPGSLFTAGRGRQRAATSAAERHRQGADAGSTATGDASSVIRRATTMTGRRRAMTSAVASRLGFGGGTPQPPQSTTPPEVTREREQYTRQVIDLLDVVDPEVSTLSTLADIQNSLFVPNLGRLVNRESYVRLSKPVDRPLSAGAGRADDDDDEKADRRRWRRPTKPSDRLPSVIESVSEGDSAAPLPHETLADGTTPIQAKGKYMILSEGLVDWDHWTDQEREELDDYVRHLLHSRKWKARRMMRGFGHYVRTPLGAFITIYATLLTVFGAAWVLFLIGWINTGSRQDYFVEVIDQVLVALFCLVGLGLAPFRAVDTYHMIHFAHYHRKTLRLYRERGLPPLPDENDLPDPTASVSVDGEGSSRPPVLNLKEQATLLYHQARFARSHTFARFHETQTHKAFPLDLLIVVVCLLDFHSCFQLALGSATWSISYHHSFKRILTSVILSMSISCNITAGLVIVVGNRRTRKTEIIDQLFRRAVTDEAVRRRERKKLLDQQRAAQQADHERRSSSLPPPPLKVGGGLTVSASSHSLNKTTSV